MNHTHRHFSHKLFLGLDIIQGRSGGLKLVDYFLSELELDVIDKTLVVGEGVVKLLFVEVLFVHDV